MISLAAFWGHAQLRAVPGLSCQAWGCWSLVLAGAAAASCGCCMPQPLRLQRSEQQVQARSSLALTVLAAAPLGCSNACFLSLHPPILPDPKPQTLNPNPKPCARRVQRHLH